MLLFNKLAQWENTKASLAGAVPYIVCYKVFKTFNPPWCYKESN